MGQFASSSQFGFSKHPSWSLRQCWQPPRKFNGLLIEGPLGLATPTCGNLQLVSFCRQPHENPILRPYAQDHSNPQAPGEQNENNSAYTQLLRSEMLGIREEKGETLAGPGMVLGSDPLRWDLAHFWGPEIWGFDHHPNWRSHIFQKGGSTTNQSRI